AGVVAMYVRIIIAIPVSFNILICLSMDQVSEKPYAHESMTMQPERMFLSWEPYGPVGLPASALLNVDISPDALHAALHACEERVIVSIDDVEHGDCRGRIGDG